MRAPWFLIVGFVCGVAISCGAPVDPKPPCGPENCEGCCSDTGDCLAGTATFECGTGGTVCQVCAANQTCRAGSCELFEGGDYDASFPDAPDASINRDAGTFMSGDGGNTGMDGGGMDAGPQDISYSAQIQPIIDAKCDTCHAGWAYDQIVNTNGRIVPGNLNGSAIYTRTLSGDMPRGGSSPLTPTQQSQLRDWILNGAPRN